MDREPENPPSALDQLYAGLAAAHMQGEDLQVQLAEDVKQLQVKADEIQARLDESEDPGEQQRLTEQLDELQDAIAAATEQLDEDTHAADEQQDLHGDGDQRPAGADDRERGN